MALKTSLCEQACQD